MSMDATTDMASNTYLHIRPADDSLTTDGLTGQFTQLHRAIDTPVEFRLVADPEADQIDYYIGAPPEGLDTLRRVMQRIVPDSYAITEADDPPLTDTSEDDGEIAVAELQGAGSRHDDWQTRLRPPTLSDAPEQHDTARVEDAPGLALGSVVEGLLDANDRVVYQALIRPKPDWGVEAEDRVWKLEHNEDTLGQVLFKTLFGPTDDIDETESTTTPAHEKGDTGSRPGTRIDSILAKSAEHSFEVNARILATGPDAEATAEDLATSFAAIGGDFYDVKSTIHTGETARRVVDAIERAEFREEGWVRSLIRRKVPLSSNRAPCIVADTRTVGHFCLLDGSRCSKRTARALGTLPEERTGLALPEEDILTNYDGEGLPLGHPLRMDGQPADRTVSLPPALQPLHVAWFGKTGAGKSTAIINGIGENYVATDGADILIDRKGDGMPEDYLKTHYAEHGDLDDVYYFDCSDTVPALSFFDIRPQLQAGISRTSAVQNVVDHYIELLRGVMGTDRFDQAVRSPDIIRYLVKALFDPVHGSDTFTHRDLQAAVEQLRTTRQPPQVSDPELEAMLEGVIANNERSFSELMQGVANRIEKIPLDDRLGRLFNHVDDDGEPAFDFYDVLDEDAVVIFDLGGLREGSEQVITLVLLSNLWTALKRREETGTGDPPLVNLYLEEAGSIAATDLLSDLLAQSRSFGLSITLAMQFPAQLRQADADAYAEVLNNVSTIVTGNVPVDDRLATRFATAEMPPEEVGNRLRALERGQWFVTLPAPFGEPEPQPFLLESLSLPPGDPDGPEPLSRAEATGFDAVFTAVEEETRQQHGLEVEAESPETEPEMTETLAQIDSTLPFADRLPNPVRYDAERNIIRCDTCDARYGVSIDGMLDAINCCHDSETVDPADVPICELQVKLSEAERAAIDYRDDQLAFLQAVYDATQRRLDPEWEFDLCWDSMTLLEEYLGLDDAAIDELVDDGLLRDEGNTPHKLYTVTPAGRDLLQERHREGVAHGDGEGDLSESSLHALMVDTVARWMDRTFVEGADSDAVETVTYHEPGDDGTRLDAAAVDEDGNVVVAAEAERSTNDLRTGAPADYDAMAACDPEESIWLVEHGDVGHEVLAALNDPAEGEPRVEKTYSDTSPVQRWNIDTDGMTEVMTLGGVRNDLRD
jgi:DNA helicase HerA-like ATPase